ncbi:MAG: hypothetical protein ACLQVX_04780, partial [Limisphaerales bacterium]
DHIAKPEIGTSTWEPWNSSIGQLSARTKLAKSRFSMCSASSLNRNSSMDSFREPTIIGDQNWKDYEVSADVCLDNGGWAGVMGRISNVGTGYGCVPKGYYLRFAADGNCTLFATTQARDAADGTQLASGTAANSAGSQWHNVKLQFSGDIIAGFVDGAQVLSVTNDLYSRGMAGLVTGNDPKNRNTACFDNLLINSVGAATPKPTVFRENRLPMYRP